MRVMFLSLLLLILESGTARCQEAGAGGLVGKVHTVLTEEFDYQDSVSGHARGSIYEVYDPEGFLLEVYRFKPNGSVWVHTILSREGWRVLKSQTTGTAPFENFTTRQFYDGEGRVTETDTYDDSGVLIKKSTNDFFLQGESTTVVSRESGADDRVNTREIVEVTDAKTGISHQVATVNGKPETDWIIERNEKGAPIKDKIVYGDGSYNERELVPDGSTVENRYSASTKSHTRQKTDRGGNLIEVIQESDTSYIRCTYSFDKKRRPTGQINYDTLGNILSRSGLEYKEDARGNWIEKKIHDWDMKTSPPQEKLILSVLRTITYY